MKKILVTGANGFIGHYTIGPLIERGFEVHSVSRQLVEVPNCTCHIANLLDYSQIDDLLKLVRPNYLLHLAWDVTPGRYWNSLNNFTWVQASVELLKRFHEYGGQRVVMAGTCAEYDWQYGFCSEYKTPLIPTSTYGVCKNALHSLMESFSDSTGLSSAWGRIFFLYGPGEYRTRLVASTIRALLSCEPVSCFHSNQIRDYLHVEDVANALVALLDSDVKGAINIGSGIPVSLKEIVTYIANKISNINMVKFDLLKTNDNESNFIVADVKRLSNEVGWRPKYDLMLGLDQTISWWKQNFNNER